MEAEKDSGGRHRRARWLALGILSFILLFHLVNNLVVLRSDTVPVVHDAADIYLNAVRLKTAMRSASPARILHSFFVDSSTVYPPFFAAVAALVMTLFGTSQDMAMMGNVLFLAVFVCSTYLLGKRLFDRETGLLAAVILSFYPAAYSFTRASMIDYPLAALISLALLLLVESGRFSSRKWSILFGVCIGTAALTAPSFSFYLIGPFLALMAGPAWKELKEKRYGPLLKTTANMALAGLSAAAIALPWYVLHMRNYLAEQRFYYGVVYAFKWGAGYLSKMMTYHPGWILSRLLLAPGAWLFGIALVHFIVKRKEHRAFLLSWIVVPFPIFLLFGIPEGFHMIRHLLPILPAAALVTALLLIQAAEAASGRWDIKKTRLVRLLTLAVMVLGALSCLLITYRGGGELSDPFARSEGNAGWLISLNYYGRTSPHSIGFDVGDVADALRQEIMSSGRSHVFFLNRHGMVSDALLTELEAAATEDETFDYVADWCLVIRLSDSATRWLEQDECAALISRADYAVIEEVTLEEFWVWDEAMYTQEVAPIANHLETSMDDYETLMTLRNELRAPAGYVTRDPAFGWLNGTVLVLRRK